MKDGKIPNPMTIHPIVGYDKEIYVKPTLKNPNIIVGDFTYIADSDFESHVTHLYEWSESSDECSFNFSFLHAGGLGHGCPVEKRFAAQGRYCHR